VTLQLLTNFDEDRVISFSLLHRAPRTFACDFCHHVALGARLPTLFWQSWWLPPADADLFDFRLVTSHRTHKQFFVFRLLTSLLVRFLWEMSSIGTGVSMPHNARYTLAKCGVNMVDIHPNLTFVLVWPIRLAIFARRTCISSGICAKSRGKWRV